MNFDSRNSLVHLELHTSDLTTACEFYEEICGWRFSQAGVGGRPYAGFDFGPEEISGGGVECGIDPPLWLPYFEVDEIRTTTRRALERGASLLLAPSEGPNGWRSVVSVPAGGEIALWQPKR